MAVVAPLSKEKAAPETHGLYDNLPKMFGRMPNIFGVMAHQPAALTSFLEFYKAVMGGGTLSGRDKELVYIATSTFNSCEY